MSESEMKKEKALDLYRTMTLIREFENRVTLVYRQGEIPGFVHLYQGEEAVAAGICEHLTVEDIVASNHRGHGHVLAKGCSVRGAMAELYARETGLSGGRGGSMHMYDKEHGLIGTNGIVGGGLPMAVGAALTFKMRKNGKVAVVFFGDGASNMGIFYESMNLASNMKLPVVFVCENNLYATSTPLKCVAANTEIATRAVAFNMPGVSVDGNDVLAIYEAGKMAVRRARSGSGPALIEAKTYRQHGHHEGDELYGTYRTKEELTRWIEEKDPIVNFEKVLLSRYGVTAEELETMKKEIVATIDDAVEFSRSSAVPKPESVHDYIFAG